MEKNHIIFALKLFIASALLGILAGFFGVKPLGINQEQVISALYVRTMDQQLLQDVCVLLSSV